MGSPPEKHYRRSPDVEESNVGERAVLYHCTLRKALVINPTGSHLWGQLDKPSTLGALAQALRRQFPSLSDQQARADVTRFLDDLVEHQMVMAEE